MQKCENAVSLLNFVNEHCSGIVSISMSRLHITVLLHLDRAHHIVRKQCPILHLTSSSIRFFFCSKKFLAHRFLLFFCNKSESQCIQIKTIIEVQHLWKKSSICTKAPLVPMEMYLFCRDKCFLFKIFFNTKMESSFHLADLNKRAKFGVHGYDYRICKS